MKTSRRSPEEAKAWREKMREVAKNVRALPLEKQQEIADRLGTVTCEGRRLSPFNCVYLMMQAGEIYPLAMVGGFQQWRKAGRFVKKGSRAAGYIFVPIGVKKAKEGGSEAEKELEEDSIRFRLVPVFDLTQTDEMGAIEKAAETQAPLSGPIEIFQEGGA